MERWNVCTIPVFCRWKIDWRGGGDFDGLSSSGCATTGTSSGTADGKIVGDYAVTPVVAACVAAGVAFHLQ